MSRSSVRPLDRDVAAARASAASMRRTGSASVCFCRVADASRLIGASVIITGLSSDIARTLVKIGVDLTKMNTIGDLQGGIEEAERQLGFRVHPNRSDLRAVTRELMFVSILRQGDFLIASIHAALDDTELMRFQEDVVDQIGRYRARGVIIDVAALDVLDSYGSKALRDLAHMARLRGATTVLVGIQPDVAFSVIRLGMNLDIHTALDLEQGLSHLEPSRPAICRSSRRGSSPPWCNGPTE